MNLDDAQRYLAAFGYEADAAVGSAAMSAEGSGVGLQAFQRFFGLPESGELDTATIAMMERPRCGVADRGVTVLAAGDAWPQRELTYAFENLTERLPRETYVWNAIGFALGIWGAATGLQFRWVGLDEDPEMVIQFSTGAHGDGLPFDGPRGVLGHAFFPPPNGAGTLAGDIHFDDDENWTVDVPLSDGEFDLVTLALHEAGHALGLTHSSDPNDIMFPIVDRLQRWLGDGDLARIAALYGDGSDGAGQVIGYAGDTHAVHSGDDQLDLFTISPTGGRRHRRRTAAGWSEWQELGGEYPHLCTVNPRGVQTADGARTIMFARSYQKHVIAQVVEPGPGPSLNLGGRRGSSFFVAGLAGEPTVFLTSRTAGLDHPLEGPQPPTGRFLLEQSYDGVTASGWNIVLDGVSTLPAMATRPDGTATLIVADLSGALLQLHGTAGAWSEPEPLPVHAPVDVGNAFWPLAACWTDPTTLDVAFLTEEKELWTLRRVGESWSAPVSFGGPWSASCLLATNGEGAVALTARRRDGATQILINGGTDWEPVLGIPDEHNVVSLAGQPGRLEILTLRPQKRLVHHVRAW